MAENSIDPLGVCARTLNTSNGGRCWRVSKKFLVGVRGGLDRTRDLQSQVKRPNHYATEPRMDENKTVAK